GICDGHAGIRSLRACPAIGIFKGLPRTQVSRSPLAARNGALALCTRPGSLPSARRAAWYVGGTRSSDRGGQFHAGHTFRNCRITQKRRLELAATCPPPAHQQDWGAPVHPNKVSCGTGTRPSIAGGRCVLADLAGLR